MNEKAQKPDQMNEKPEGLWEVQGNFLGMWLSVPKKPLKAKLFLVSMPCPSAEGEL